MSDEYVSKSGLTYYHNKLKTIFQTKMVVLSYGLSTWSDFIAAYNANAVVYCKASSNSNPGTGSQTRRAFMAYLNNNDNPTNVEFQYYRSVSSHSATQQGDQVFVYKLDKTSGWSVITREASVNIAAGSGLSRSYSSNVVTLEVTGKQDTLVSGTNIKTINSNSILGSGDLSITSDVTDVTVDGTSVVSSGVAEINLTGKADTSSLATVATSGSYSDLSNKPTIPSNTSDLTNDSGFIAEDSNGDISITRNIWANGKIEADGDLSNNGNVSTAGAIASDGDIESLNGDVLDGNGNVLADKANTSDLATVATSGSYSDLSNRLTASFNPGSAYYLNGLYVDSGVVVKDNISVPTTGGSYLDVTTVSLSKTGYTLIGPVGIQVANASSTGTGGAYGIVTGYSVDSGRTTMSLRVKSVSSTAIKVKVTMDLLYAKTSTT